MSDPVDPNDLTQPMSAVPGRERVVEPPPPVAPAVVVRTYVPVFGNLGAYLFARLAAVLIDGVALPFVVACFLFNAADRGALAFAPKTAQGFGAIAALSFGGAVLFAILCETIFETTLGKALFALGVRRKNGRHPSIVRIFVRYLLLPLDIVLVGPLLALVTPRHQRLGDLLSGTVVARNRIGGFVTAFALVLFGALVYAQATLGGGITSALGVLAESSFYGPPFVAGVASHFGAAPGAAVVPAVLPSAQSSPADTATPEGSFSTQAPAQEPSEIPSEEPSDEPTIEPTQAPTPLPLQTA